MNTLLEFFLENYIWVLIVSLIVIFALIGYLVDSSTNNVKVKKKKNRVKPIEAVRDDEIRIHHSVEAYTNDQFDKPLMEEKN